MGYQKRLENRLQKKGILVAEKVEDSEKPLIIGLLVAEILVNPIGIAEGHITLVIVSKNFRKQNIGKMLLEYAINHLEQMGSEVIKLDIEENFIDKLEYFKSLGFKESYRVLVYHPKT